MPASADAPVDPARARLARGMRIGMPIFLGYAPVGAAFGIVARDIGFSPLQAVVCSATALAGAGQFIALSLLANGGGLVTVAVATTVVNLRYVLFSATLSPHLRRTPVSVLVPLGFTLTDETFAVNVTGLRAGTADEYSMAGVGLVAWTGWVSGTATGALAASVIGDPAAWGVEFAMPAMFVALLVAQAQDRRHATVGALAAALAIVFALVFPGTWYVVAAPVVAAAVATAVER